MNNIYESSLTLEQQSYIYGLFLTDGAINLKKEKELIGEAQLELALKDQDIINKLNLIIKNSHILQRVRNTNFKTNYESICLRIYRHEFLEFLNNMGFPLKDKTKNAKPPIKDYDKAAFWRGIIDGDGSLGIRKTSKGTKEVFLSLTTQSESLKEAYCNFLTSITKEKYNPQRNVRDNIYNITCGMSSTKKVCDYLYKNASIYLDRKYQKYLEIKAFIENNNIQIKQTYTLLQIDPKTKNIIATFNSCAEAQRITGFSHLADASNPSKKEGIHHGYIWRRVFND